jgi:bifunctional UDP-N-acetylglucosamine pyrophosphorylase / glucosamine-1-phosphate N-acetyltransferase
MLDNVQAVILAGGISERFQTGKTKFIEKICGTEMILYPINLLKSLHIPTTLVIGLQPEQIKQMVQKHDPSVTFVLQEQALGTGHAAQLTKNVWTKDHILIMNGDIPLITADIINKLYRKHTKTDADISFITAHTMDIDSTKYSRVVIDNNQIKVMEEPTTELDESNQCCISAGIYLAKRSFLEKHIDKITKNSATDEYYLPELIHIASQHHSKIVTTQASLDIVRSIDTLADLWAVEHIKRSELLQQWMNHGVRFANTFTVQLDNAVRIEPGSHIGSGVLLLGDTTIKKSVTIGAYTQIENSIVEEGVTIPSHVIITNSIITKSMNLKSFTHIEGMSPKSKQEVVFTGALKTGYQEQSF